MLFSLHGGHVMDHALQQEQVPFLFLGGAPAQMLSAQLIQEQLTLKGPVSYPV